MILGIYGAGGLGREVLELAKQINENSNRWKEIVFIDDAEYVSLSRKNIVYTWEEIIDKFGVNDIEVCIAIGEPAIRAKLANKINNENYKLATLIHPSVYIPDSTKIGQGVIISLNDSISCDITIHNNVYIHPTACIGHDSIIYENTVISSFVDIAGNCMVGENTYIGLHVCLKEGISVGSETIVGVSSAVLRDLPDNVIALGNPARPMKHNDDKRVFK